MDRGNRGNAVRRGMNLAQDQNSFGIIEALKAEVAKEYEKEKVNPPVKFSSDRLVRPFVNVLFFGEADANRDSFAQEQARGGDLITELSNETFNNIVRENVEAYLKDNSDSDEFSLSMMMGRYSSPPDMDWESFTEELGTQLYLQEALEENTGTVRMDFDDFQEQYIRWLRAVRLRQPVWKGLELF